MVMLKPATVPQEVLQYAIHAIRALDQLTRAPIDSFDNYDVQWYVNLSIDRKMILDMQLHDAYERVSGKHATGIVRHESGRR